MQNAFLRKSITFVLSTKIIMYIKYYSTNLNNVFYLKSALCANCVSVFLFEPFVFDIVPHVRIISCFNFTTIISHQICYQSKCKLHQPFVVQVSSVSLSQLNCCDGFFKFPQIYHLCESNKFIYIHIYKENIISRLSTSRYSLMHLQHRLAPIRYT